MRRLLFFASVVLAAACSEAASDGLSVDSSAGGSGTPAGDWVSGEGQVGIDGGVTVPAGQLTAGILDDNWNYAAFEAFLDGAELLTAEERLAANTASLAERSARGGLDVALVLDTTGSMGDEIAYLKAELAGIAADLSAAYPSASLRFALVAYKDHGDDYVTQVTGFTADLAAFTASVGALSAAGGGDTPEAVPEALAAANALAWREDDAIGRVALWVADAPAHDHVEDDAMDEARTARDAAIRYYPVASSGVDDAAEREMRSVAQLTGGRYIFLTDDSGLGNGHAEPTADCYYVTTLRDAMARVLRLELTGEYAPPDANEIVRAAGEPVDGLCGVDGGVVRAF